MPESPTYVLRLGGSGAYPGRYFACECATHRLVPTGGPVLFLTRGATVPGVPALRANFEILQMAHNLAPLVEAKLSPLHRCSAHQVEPADWITPPLPQPMYHVGQNIRGDVVALHEASRLGDPGGLRHVPDLTGVGLISIHVIGEVQARVGEAVLGSLTYPPRRHLLTTRDAAQEGH